MLSTLEYVLEIPIKILNSGSPLSVFLETTDSGYIMSGVVQDARSRLCWSQTSLYNQIWVSFETISSAGLK